MNALTVTTAGQQRIASALLSGVSLNIVEMAIGASLASLLTVDSTSIGSEVISVPIDKKTVTGSQITFEGVIPEAFGPATLNAVGLYENTGLLLAFGALPGIFKPAITDGFGVAIRIKATVIFSNGSAPVTVISTPQEPTPTTNRLVDGVTGTTRRIVVNDGVIGVT